MGSKAVGQKVKFKMLLVLQMFTILDSFREGKRLNVRLVIKEFTCLFLLLAAVMMPLSFLPDVGAAMSVSALNPSSGNVGTSVQVLSNLTTANGTYQVLFDDSIVRVNEKRKKDSIAKIRHRNNKDTIITPTCYSKPVKTCYKPVYNPEKNKEPK